MQRRISAKNDKQLDIKVPPCYTRNFSASALNALNALNALYSP